MPPPTRRASDRRGGSAERLYQPQLDDFFPFGRSQTSAPSAKPITHPSQPTHWTPKPATIMSGRNLNNTPYSRPVALREASQRSEMNSHTAATSYVHRSGQGAEGPLWDPVLEDVRIRASPRISEIQQEHRMMTPDINWNSQLSRESHHPTAPFRPQQTSREVAVLTHSYSFNSDEAYDNFELGDEVLAEHCERMEEEDSPPPIPSTPPVLIKPVARRPTGVRFGSTYPTSQVRCTLPDEDLGQQRQLILDAHDLAGLEYAYENAARHSKSGTRVDHRSQRSQDNDTIRKRDTDHVEVESDGDDDVPNPMAKQTPHFAHQLPVPSSKPKHQALAALPLIPTESPSPSPSPAPFVDPAQPPCVATPSDIVVDGEDDLGLIHQHVPSPPSDHDLDLDDIEADAFLLKPPTAIETVDLQTLTRQSLIPRKYQSSTESPALRSRSPSPAGPSIPQSGQSRTQTKRRKKSVKTVVVPGDPVRTPDIKREDTPDDCSIINGRKYSNKQLAEWRADGWVGPRDEACFAGKPRWKVASTGYDPEPPASDQPALPPFQERSPPRPRTPRDAMSTLPPCANHDEEVEHSRMHDPELADSIIWGSKIERISSAIQGERFYISDGDLLSQTLHDIALNPHVLSDDFRFDKRMSPILDPIAFIHLGRMPRLSEAGAIQALARDIPGGRLFPNARHLRLSWRAQSQLLKMLYEHYDDGKYKVYLRALATIADVRELCTDYDIRALDSHKLRHGMDELRTVWPNLTIHHIHHALDDIPYTMSGVIHDAIFDMASWPFCKEPWTLDYEPNDVDVNLDPDIDELEDDMAEMVPFERTIATHSGTANTVDPRQAIDEERSREAKRLKAFEKFKKEEAKAAAQARLVNTYTPWFLNIARTILQDYARGPRDPPTRWKVTLPKLPNGPSLGNLGIARRAMMDSLRAGLSGGPLHSLTLDQEQLHMWVSERIRFQYGPPGRCQGCGKSCGSDVTTTH